MWEKFAIELDTKCTEQKVDFFGLRDWILESVEKINERSFDYYISTGPSQEDRNQKIDVTILLERRLYSFTVSQLAEIPLTPLKKEFSIFSLGDSIHYLEETAKESITCTFILGHLLSFFITDSVTNSSKLREFAHKVLESAWGRQ